MANNSELLKNLIKNGDSIGNMESINNFFKNIYENIEAIFLHNVNFDSKDLCEFLNIIIDALNSKNFKIVITINMILNYLFRNIDKFQIEFSKNLIMKNKNFGEKEQEFINVI